MVASSTACVIHGRDARRPDRYHLPRSHRSYIPHIGDRFRVNLSSVQSRGYGIRLEDLAGGFVLPESEKSLDFTSIGYGALDEGHLVWGQDAVQQAAVLPAGPFVIRAVAGGGVGGASAGSLAAGLRP